MERPIKRRKTIQRSADAEDEDEDELFLEPEELNQRRDPAFQLEQGRALAVNKLKSRFEDIFAKYGKDFTGIGDEIDLMTGDVVVDNGHLQSMRSEKDAGDGHDYDEEDSSEEEERNLHGRRITNKGSSPTAGMTRRDPWQVAGSSWPRPVVEGTPRLTSLFSNQPSFMSPSWSVPPFGLETPTTADPVWQAPEVPASAFFEVGNRIGAHERLSPGQRSATRKVTRRSLPAPASPDADDEDVLLSVSGNMFKKQDQESPLIRRKFPPVDSPNEDTAHNDLINEVMGNLSDTSPSMQRPKISKRRGRPPKVKEKSTANSNPAPGRKSPSMQGWRMRNTSPLPNLVLELDDSAAEANRSDQMLSEQSDRESFSDITRNGFVKPAEQILCVDIRASANDSGETVLREENDAVHPNVLDKTATIVEGFDAETRAPDAESIFVVETIPKSGNQSPTAQEDSVKPNASSKKPHTEEIFERNVVNPSFTFSDEETLLPKRARKQRQRSGLVKPVVAPPSQESQGIAEADVVTTALDRNAVDPSYAFSDEDNLLPKRAKRGTGKSEPVASAGDLAKAASLAARGSNQEPTVDVQTARDGIEIISRPSQEEETDEPTTTRSSVPNELPKPIEEDRQRRVSELGNPSLADTSITLATHGERPDSEPVTKPAPVPQPSTPRPKSKISKKMASPATSLISLVSDNEDSEDEISFNLADFTPSGQHRILVHRPFPQLASSAKSSGIKKKKKKRISLILGHHSASAQKAKTPRTSTPDPSSRDKKNKHHRKSASLARSVVRARPGRDGRGMSPTDSVVQTPGGTKRRCGEEGFTCDRDFCFVCL